MGAERGKVASRRKGERPHEQGGILKYFSFENYKFLNKFAVTQLLKRNPTWQSAIFLKQNQRSILIELH